MKFRSLYILELYTEETAVINILRSLKGSAWRVTLVCSPLLAKLVPDRAEYNVARRLLIDCAGDIAGVDWQHADLVLLPSGRFMPANYGRAFLESVGSTPYGIGVFGTSVLKKKLHRFRSLWTRAYFVYVSDVDFIKKDNEVSSYAAAAGKKVLVVPFNFPTQANRTISKQKKCVVISGTVQWKRRHYITSLLLLFISAHRLGTPLEVILNGRCRGLYGKSVSLLAKILSRVSTSFEVTTYPHRIYDDVYRENLTRAQINLMPLSSMYYDGKDCGAFYDAIEFNMINICPSQHLRSIGTEHGCLTVGYESIFEMTTCVTTVLCELPGLLDTSFQISQEYLQRDFRGYLIDQLNILSQNY